MHILDADEFRTDFFYKQEVRKTLNECMLQSYSTSNKFAYYE